MELRRTPLAALLPLALAASACVAAEPNETFDTATTVPSGTMLVAGDLTAGVAPNPDTYLGIRDISGLITQVDDNGSIYGNGFASGIQSAPTNGTTLAFSVTGVGDLSFKGNHTQSGKYALDVFVRTSTGASAAFIGNQERELQPGVVHNFSFTGDASWINGSYSVNIENRKSEPVGGDVDYYKFVGLKPGVAFTAQSFDPAGRTNMFLYQFNSFATPTVPLGATLASKDNNGNGPPTMNIDEVTGTVPANGILIFAVTGFGDLAGEKPAGEHTVSGSYQLRVFQPGPTANFDNSGAVGAADLLKWREAIRDKTAGGDADRDFDTDGSDFLLWQRQLGKSAAIAATGAVPEPASALLLVCCTLATIAHARRHR